MPIDHLPRGDTGAFADLVQLRRDPERPHVTNVELTDVAILKRFESFECHVVLYPYSPRISSSDYDFYPFEEYIDDITEDKRSAYEEIGSAGRHIFGLALGVLLAGIAVAISKESIISVESMLSLLGAYFVGKDLWVDIERVLVEATKTWRLRYLPRTFRYRLEKHNTLTMYSALARRQRYGVTVLLPELLDFIDHSNSQTVRMCFRARELREQDSSPTHILCINMRPDLVGELERHGFMLGVKVSFNTERLGLVRSFEVFQSLHLGERGCLDGAGTWHPEAVFYRRTARVGRLKLFREQGVTKGRRLLKLLDAEPPPDPAAARPG